MLTKYSVNKTNHSFFVLNNFLLTILSTTKFFFEYVAESDRGKRWWDLRLRCVCPKLPAGNTQVQKWGLQSVLPLKQQCKQASHRLSTVSLKASEWCCSVVQRMSVGRWPADLTGLFGTSRAPQERAQITDFCWSDTDDAS